MGRIMRSRRRWTVDASIIAVAALVLSACTSDTRPARSTAPATFPVRSASGSPSPGVEQTSASTGEKCTITSQVAVARAFGAKRITETVGVTAIGNRVCRFALSTTNVGLPGTLTVTAGTAPTSAAFARAVRATPGAVVVPGMGRRAYYVPRSATVQLIGKGTHVVLDADIRVPGSSSPKPALLRRDMQQLARAVAAGL